MRSFAEQVRTWFVRGLWSQSRVEIALVLGKITRDEFDVIMGIEPPETH